MKRFILTTLLVVTCALPVLAQTKTANKPAPPCNLQIDRAPELRGFRLGATQASTLARFPGTSAGKPNELGVAEVRLSVIDSSTLAKGLPRLDRAVQPDLTAGNESAFVLDAAKFLVLKGVRKIRLQFTDSRLSSAELGYDNSITWTDIDEFVETVSYALNLPSEWRRAQDASENVKELRCEGFVLTGSVGGDATDTRVAAQLTVEDLGAAKVVEKRQSDLKEKAQRAEDARRKNFKP